MLHTVQDALDLMADATYLHQTKKLLLPKSALPEEFFLLRTGLAGEILQKFTNYGVTAAIVGDFSGYNSTSLRDFIRESNRQGKILFLPNRQEALEALHAQD